MNIWHTCPTCCKAWRGHEDLPDYCTAQCSDFYPVLMAAHALLLDLQGIRIGALAAARRDALAAAMRAFRVDA